MIAAEKGNVGIVRKLIHHGASVNLTNKVNQVLIQGVCTRVWQEDWHIQVCTCFDFLSTEWMSFKPPLAIVPVTPVQPFIDFTVGW